MKAKSLTPPTEPFVKLPRDLLRSDAWRSLGINGRRFIDFLMLEHMSHGGKENGKLKAPYLQLEQFGIGSHFAAAAIAETEDLGLIAAHRGGMRVATIYALTWLPLHDGTPASNQWQGYRNPELKPLSKPKFKNLPAKQQAGLPANQQADGANLPAKQQADGPQTLPAKQQVLSRRSYQGGAISHSGNESSGVLPLMRRGAAGAP